jgi:ADP-ribosyl-[dinitrogen reductase] hydrolase
VSHSAIVGSILGTAIGDALGLPYEGMSKRRAARMWGEPTRYRFLFGRGMVSDDTEHTCMVTQALIASGGEPNAFSRELAKRLRWWLLGLPAGIGKATLRACLKLWIGYSPERSGVFSAGNGPAMRSPILGIAIKDLGTLSELVRLSTLITHTDPKAEQSAVAVALAASLAAKREPVEGRAYWELLRSVVPDAEDFLPLIEQAVRSAEMGESTEAFAISLGLHRGVSGYVYHTVPVAIHAWLRHPEDYQAAVTSVIRCGGDTDSTAAIVGGIVGARVGKEGIPTEWLSRLFEWPRSVAWMEALGRTMADTLSAGQPRRAPRLSALGLVGRNLVFLVVVLVHVVRRCLPPY